MSVSVWLGKDEKPTLAETHADSTHEEQIATPELLNHVQTREGRSNIDAVGNDLNNERILEAGALEVLSSVVDCR